MEKRVCFQKGYQKDFIKYIKNNSRLKWKELSKKLNVKEGTLSKSYRYELCFIPYNFYKKCISLIEEDEKKTLKKYNAKIIKGKLVIGRKVLGEQKKVLDKINIKFRKNNLNLNCSTINYSKNDKNKEIIFPNNITSELAEEMGMHFGDGFLSSKQSKRYEYRLKGNFKDEVEYYQKHILPLFKKLYNLNLNLKRFDSVIGFEIKSRALWDFKTKIVGIKSGKKYDIRYPKRLKVNNLKIITAFLRGLYDTDGSLSFKTKYGYTKYYPAIEITLSSKKFIKEVGEILFMLGFRPGVYFNEKYGKICIYGIAAFKRYEELIGWSSPKNLNKVQEWKYRYPQFNK